MTLKTLFAIALVLISASSSQSQTRSANNVDHSNDDSELLKEAFKLSYNGDYLAARFLFESIISGYPNSELIRQAKLGLADSYYAESDYRSRVEADSAYVEWLKCYSDGPLAEDVGYRRVQNELKLAKYSHGGGDGEQAYKAEHVLKEFLKTYPDSAHRFEAQADLKEVQETLATSDLNVALFYMNNRYAWSGAEGRLKEVLEKYPDFSEIERVLYLLGKVEMKKNDDAQATEYLRQLIEKHPNSQYRKAACDQLALLGLIDECKE